MNELALFGGQPLRTLDFPPRISMGPEEKAAAMRVLDRDVLSGFVGAPGKFFNGGQEVTAFEERWASEYGFKHALSVNSWTSGLQVAMGALGIEAGDEVICPPYTMSASATAALFYGGIPIFADIDPRRYTICPQSIENKITKYTKAIVVVHLFGMPADMDPILEIAKRYKLKVIEDCAQSPGAYYKGRPVGTLGDIGGFSLNFHKHIQAGEGGVLVTNDDDIAQRCSLIRNHGENVVEDLGITNLSNTIGGNYRFSELHAAISSEQFKKLKPILNHRKKMGAYLSQALTGIKGLELPIYESGTTNCYYMYPIKFDSKTVGVSRNQFVKAVSAELPQPKHWDTTPLAEGYVKPLYLNQIYQKKIALGSNGFPFNFNKDRNYDYKYGDCPVTEKLYENELIISPLVREGIFENDLDDFVNAIKKVLDNIKVLQSGLSSNDDEIYDPVKAIEANVAKNQ